MAVRKQRILHFIESGGLYGAERVILNLSQAMARQGSFTPVVGCIVSHLGEPSDLYTEAKRLGIEAVKLVIPNALVLTALPSVGKQLKGMGVDLIHSHGYKPSVYGFLLQHLTGISVTATCHLWFEMDKGPLKTRMMIWLEKWVYRRFPLVVGVSEDIRRTLIDNGIPSSKVQVVENGVDLPDRAMDAEQRLAFRRQLGVPDGAVCVLNAGRLTRQKGQWTLVQAAGYFTNQDDSVFFLIAGDGKLRPLLEETISEYGVADHVALLGFRTDIKALLEACDVLVMPSLDEGMPMVLLEAVALKVPVVVTEVGDIPKLIVHDESGQCIPKEHPVAIVEAVKKLQANPDWGRELAAKAFETLREKYSIWAMHRRYDQIYRDLLKGNVE